MVVLNTRSNVQDLQPEVSDEEQGELFDISLSGIKMVTEAKLKLPKLPTRRHEVRDFHIDLMDAILQIS